MSQSHTGLEKYDRLIEVAVRPFMEDPRFRGVALVGSIATREFTPYSDIDVLLLHGNEYEDEIKGELPLMAGSISGFIIGDFYDLSRKDVFGFCLTDELVHVDWFRFNPETLQPKHYMRDMVILKDDGTLAHIKAKAVDLPEVDEITTDELVKTLLYLRMDFIYAPRKFMKGDRAEGLENVKWMFDQLIHFKYRLIGKDIWDYRKYEKVLTRGELDDWRTITTLEPTAGDIENGLKINWRLMKGCDEIVQEMYGLSPFKDFDMLLWARIDALLAEAKLDEP